MLRVMLADDNILTLNEIAQIINRGDMDATVVAQVTDGDKAAQQLFKLRPDVLIADVEMPVMNGVELSRFIVRRKLPVKLIALSNYDNYEYVRPIMKNGAMDYLLKHEITPELIREKLNEVRRQKESERDAATKDRIYTLLAKQSFLSDILMGGQAFPADGDMENMMRQKEFQFGSYSLLILQLENYNILYYNRSSGERKKIAQSVLNVCTSICATVENGIVCATNPGEFVVLFHFEKNASSRLAQESTAQYAALLSGNLNRLLGFQVRSGIAVFMDDVVNARAYYLSALKGLSDRADSADSSASAGAPMNVYTEKRLLDALYHGDHNAIGGIVNEIMSGVQDEIEVAVCQALDIIGRFEKDYCLPGGHLEKIKQLVAGQHSQEELRRCIVESLLEVSRIFHQYHMAYSRYVQNAVGFIHDNYYKDISLQDAAQQNAITGVYLSKKFSSEVGKSFIEYLNDYRIEMAKKIMQDGKLNVADIYGRVGFRSYNYFIRSFREKTGVTPLQYMKKLR